MRTIYRAAAFLFLITGSAAVAGNGVYTLQEAYDAALRSNETIAISGENTVQAGTRAEQAWTYLYPRLTANGSFTRYNDVLPPGGGSFIFQPLEQTAASLVLTQPLYTGGRTLAALRIARTLHESSESELSSVKQTVMMNVAEAYYAVLKAQKFVEVSKNSLERMERHKKITQREATTRRTKMNASSLLRANTLVNQARISLLKSEDGLKIARQKLSLLTKLPLDLSVAEPSSLTAPAIAVESLLQIAVKNRPDYASAQANRRVARESVTVTEGAHYPQVYAEGGLTYVDSYPKTGLDAATQYAGIRLQIPIFEGGLLKAERAEARSKVRQAELAEALLKRTIENEVSEAFVNLQTMDGVLTMVSLQFEDAKKNFDMVEGLFSEGLVQSLSLIDAEQALSLSEQALVSATWDRQLAILKLQKAVGLLGPEAGS
jgi:outer membrane protein